MRVFAMLKEAVRFLLAVGCAGVLFAVCRSPVLEEGKSHTFYYAENSSAPLTFSAPLAALLSGEVKGESVTYSGDRYQEFVQKYAARLLFEERLDGVVSYYLYSPRLVGFVRLNGKRVNLQIAVGSEQTVVGTPLIFGGW